MKRTGILLFCLLTAAALGCSEDRNVIIPAGGDGHSTTDPTPEDPDDPPAKKDECPDDPDKTEPGECGCGVPDSDINENGIIDCVEAGTNIDACPDDPAKTQPGKCGCGVPDSPENVADSDDDGVINCKDECPYNADKTVMDSDGCGTPTTVVDSDGDTVPDSEDACPNNPEIKENIANGPVECEPGSEPVEPAKEIIEIRTAKDFETARTMLNALQSSPTEGQYCNNAAPNCRDDKTLLECRNGIWRTLSCGSCTGSTCSSPSNAYNMPPQAYIVRIMNDIDFGRDYAVTTNSDGTCTTAEWKSLPYVNSIRFEAVNNAVISFTNNGKRCALPEALIHQATLSEFANLTLDFDMTASARASLLDIADSTSLKNVVYKGTLKTNAESNVGGIIAQTKATQDNSSNNAILTQLTDVVCANASIYAEKATVVGGIIGRMADAVLTTPSLTHQVAVVKGESKVGGIVGEMTSDFDKPVVKNFKSNITSVECTSSYCAGGIGIVTAQAELNGITHKVSTVTSNPSEYTAGFAGSMFIEDESTAGSISVKNVTSEVTTINAADGIYASGFAAYAAGKVSLNGITSKAGTINGSYFAGGFLASTHGITAENISNCVALLNVKSTTLPASYIGGFAAEISGGTYTKIASTVKLTASGKNNAAPEDANSIGGFAATVSDAIQLTNIYSQADITGDYIFPGGFIGRQETNWTTPNAAKVTMTNIVSMSSLYSTANNSNYKSNAIAGSLTTYTASQTYFLAPDSGYHSFTNKDGSNLTALNDSNKASVLSALQAAWSGWKAGGTVSLNTGSFSGYPTFDAGNGI